MGIEVAVSPSVRSPGLALRLNLLGEAQSPGTAISRAVILAPKASSGTITADTQLVESVGGHAAVSALLGASSPGHLAARRVFEEHPLAQVDIVGVTASVGATATATLTFDDTVPVTVPRSVFVYIAGREVSIAWNAGVTKIAAATLLVSAINAQASDIPVVASNGGGTLAVVTLSHVVPGLIGNDCKVFLTVKDGIGGTVALSSATLVGGTLEPNFTAALALIAGREYDKIIPCVGNADAQAASATSNPSRVKAHIDVLDSGFTARLQEAVVGTTGLLSAAKTGSAQQNFGPLQYAYAMEAQSLPCEWAGAEAGARLAAESLKPVCNRVNTKYLAKLFGARDLINDAPTEPELEDGLQSGLTVITYDSSNLPRPSRPISTYFKDTGGNPDSRLLDVSQIHGAHVVARDLRAAIPQQFPNVNLINDLPDGEDELPDGVVEVGDVRDFVITRLRFWQKRGVVRGPELDKAIKDGSLIVRVNPSDASQCDLVLPYSITRILAKFSLVLNKMN